MLSFDEVKEKARKSVNQTAPVVSKVRSWEQLKDDARKNLASSNRNAQRDISDWFTTAQRLSQNAYQRYSAEGYKPPDRTIENVIARSLNDAGKIRSLVSANREKYDDYEAMIQSLDDTVAYLQSMREGVKASNDYYSKFESQEAYDNNMRLLTETEADWQKKTETLSGSIDTEKRHLEQLQTQQMELLEEQGKQDGAFIANENKGESKALQEGIAAAKRRIQQLEAELEAEKQWQDANRYVLLQKNEDFDQYSKDLQNYQNPSYEDLEYYDVMMDNSRWKTDPITGKRTDAFGNEIDPYNTDESGAIVHPYAKDARYTVTDPLGMYLNATEAQIEMGYTAENPYSVWGNLVKEAERNNWKQLTEPETDAYYYLLNTQGTEAALQFLRDSEAKLNYREGVAQAQKIQEMESGLGKAVAMGLYGLDAGMEQWATGFAQAFQSEEITPGASQFGSSEIAGSLSGLGKYAFQATNTVGNMLPYIGLSSLMAHAGAPAKVAKSVGSVTMGISAGGNAYGQALREGYDEGSARMYGALVGASEVLLENFLSTLGPKDAGSAGKLMGKLSTIDNALLRIAAKIGVDTGSEILEEEIQNYLEPAFRTILFGEDYDAPTIQEILETAIITALSTPALSAGGTISEDIREGKAYRDQYGSVQKELIEAGLDEGENSASARLAQKYQKILDSGKNLTGHQLSHLVEVNEKQFRAADEKAISQAAAERLVELGETGDVNAIGAALAKQAAGRRLSWNERNMIASSRYGQRVANELNAENIQSGDYASQWAQKIRTERIQTEAYNDAVQDGRSAQAGLVGQNIPEVLTGETDGIAPQSAKDNAVAGDATLWGNRDFENAEYVPATKGKVLFGDNRVEISKVVSAGNGKMTLALDDGSTAQVTQLSFPNEGATEVYHTVARLAQSTGEARKMLELYKVSNVSDAEFARGIEEAYLYGKLNYSRSEMESKGSYVNLLTPQIRESIYTLGQTRRQINAQTRQQQLVDARPKATRNSGDRTSLAGIAKGKVHFDGDRGKLTDRQKTSLTAMKVIARALGVDIYVYEPETSGFDEGARKNGWYDPEDGSIHINLYAGENGEGVMLFTLAHELTHFIRDWSPTKYNVLADFLTEQYGKKGIPVRQQVLLKQADAAAEGRTLTEEQAHEEWVADCMEKMLSDGQIVEKLALLQAKDRGIVAKIRGYLDKFLKKLKAAYGEVEPQTLEGQTVATMVDAAQKLQELFADALTDAAANYHANGKKNPTETGGEVRLSAREESLYKDFSNKVNAVVNQAITGKGNMEGRVQVVDIMPVGPKLAAMVAASSESEIDISNRSISLNTGDVWHEYKRHTSVSDEVSRDQVAFTKRQFQNAIKCMISPDVVETIFRDANNPTQKQSFAYAKKTDRGHYVVVEAVGGKKNPNIYPVMILQFSKAKWDRMIQQGKTLGEILLEGDTKKLQALDVAKNKKSRVTAAQFASYEAIANTLHSPQLNDIVAQTEFSVKENDSTEKRFSSQGGTAVSDRAMLIDLFAQMVENSNEYRALEHYRSKLDEMLAVEEQLQRVSEEIRKRSFQKGPKDMETLRRLKILQKKAVNRLNIFDNQLLRLEKSGVLRAMIERNRAIVTQKSFDRAKEYYRNKNEKREAEIRAYYRESRRQAVERHNKAQIRQQIKKDVDRLDSLLNKGNKQRNVKLELQDFAGAALRSARNALLKGYNEYDMVRNGISGDLTREQKKLVAECRELMNRLDNLPPLDDSWDPDKAVQWYKTEDEIKQPLQKKMKILRDASIFQREYEKQEDAKATELLDELLKAYKALENAPQAHMQKAFSQVVYDQIENVREFLTGKQIGDMTYLELKEVYKMYHMVLHVITGANNLFTLQREGDVRKLGEEVISQIKTAGKEMSPEVWEMLKKMGWTLLKPETAFEIIGSDTLMELYRGLYRGEDTYARNVEEARQYAEQQAEKYGRAKWDMNEKIQFAGTTITLGQAMSLYAYTKREQAQGHLAGDGFTGSSNVRIKKRPGKLPVQLSYIMNATKTHTVSREDFQSVGDLLTKEQMQYADAMQDYLSHVMGSKGNEVSRQLYGINLFEETAYFPLKTAQEYLEATLGVKKGEAKLKNSGFTNAPQKGAKNPIVLDSFEDVWAKHVDDMSMYHAFVLPMEDLDRVYNYHHAVEENITDWAGNVYGTEWVNTNETVKVDLENRFGKAANDYITDLMQELNGGVRRDPTEVLFGGLLRNFKKTAVLGSLSVAVQQPTAFARAMAELDPQDVFDYRKWLGQKGKPEGRIVEEMYKYAPVALMKHIGGFDPGVGRTTKSYIFGNNQSVREKVNDALGMLPEKMDEWTWTYIWLCTKRQIHRQYPQLAMQSEAFLQKAGERFSQIIRDTQVYDSVLTKPQIMRSKNFFLQMATAFMNEPMTSLDMYIQSTVQAKRGKISKKKLARVWGSVVASQILCSAVASLIYALRDDDEDETYWEKYVSSFVGKSLENLFPLNYVPFVKDVISIFSGYTVERSDMSIITDIYEGWQKISNGTGSAWERYEAFYGSILNLLGIPARNLSRDLRGIFNTTKQAIEGKVTATSAGMKYAAMEGLYGKKASKEKQLNEAVAKNDAGHILRLMASYDDADSAMTAIRKAVKDQLLAEVVTEEKAMELLQAYTEDTKEEAQDKVLQWQCELDTGVEYGEIKESYLSGSISGSEVVKYQKLYGGKTEEETENTTRSYIKAGYEGDTLSESKARQELIRYGGLDESEASQKVRYWDFQNRYPQYSELSEAAVAKYYDGYYKDGEIYGKSAESYGIRLDIYAQYVEETKGLNKEEKLRVIDDLKLTDEQKDGLYYLNGWAKSTIDEAPWH